MEQIPLKNEFRNWLKACLSLKCVRNGMVPLLEKHCNEHYFKIQSDVKSMCNSEYLCNQCDVKELEPNHKHTNTKCALTKCSCKEKNKKPCPANRSCGVVYDQIKIQHFFNDPNWSNSDSKLWSGVPWEQMKCYIKTPGYINRKNLDDADLTAMIQICLNYQPLRISFGQNLIDLEEVLRNRNEIYHSSKLSVSDIELQRLLSHLKTFLKLGIFKDFDSVITVQQETLQKLESDDYSLTKQIELDTLNDALDGIQQSVDEMLENQTKISHEIDHLLNLQGKLKDMCQERFSELQSRTNEVLMQQRKDNEQIIKHILDQKEKISSIHEEISSIHEIQSKQGEVMINVHKDTGESRGLLQDVYITLKELVVLVKSKKTVGGDGDSASESSKLDSKITLKMEDTNASDHLSEKMHKAANGVLTHSTINQEEKELSNACAEGLKVLQRDGNTITDIKLKCVEIYIKSPSLQSWMTLCDDFFNGMVMASFEPLQCYFRTFPGSENMTINIVLDETAFASCVKAIMENIEEEIKQHKFESMTAQPFQVKQVVEALDNEKMSIHSKTHGDSYWEKMNQRNIPDSGTGSVISNLSLFDGSLPPNRPNNELNPFRMSNKALKGLDEEYFRRETSHESGFESIYEEKPTVEGDRNLFRPDVYLATTDSPIVSCVCAVL